MERVIFPERWSLKAGFKGRGWRVGWKLRSSGARRGTDGWAGSRALPAKLELARRRQRASFCRHGSKYPPLFGISPDKLIKALRLGKTSIFKTLLCQCVRTPRSAFTARPAGAGGPTATRAGVAGWLETTVLAHSDAGLENTGSLSLLKGWYCALLGPWAFFFFN